MHNAPSVKYPVGRSAWAGALLLCLWLAGLGVVALWSWVDPAPGRRQALGLALAAGVGAWAAWHWRHLPRGELGWDGAAWAWDGEAGTGGIEVALDLQVAMLLRRPGQGQGAWLWLERGAAPAHWSDIRRAVYSRANPDAPQRAEPPSATP
jgi:hypothetical protein